MKPWIVLTSLLGAAFSLPLPPHSQHPGYVNFSYEILSPIKWYHNMMKHQYPNYGYEPVSGWLQNPVIPMMPQQQLPHQHAMPKLQPRQPILIPQQPMIPLPPHLPMIPLQPQTPHLLNPTFTLTNPEGQLPTNTQPMQPAKTDPQNQPGQPLYPIQPNPPLVGEKPQDPWQPIGKNKMEEVD
ncbi:amelogenin, X isoform [Discoglossus pictus]